MLRRKRKPAPGAQVAMSPLIDCVFLLLIFFLVTTMLKKYERQIPVSLADPSAVVALEPAGRSIHVGIDRQGQVYREHGTNPFGVITFSRAEEDLPVFLQKLKEERPPDTPVELVVEPGTPFQKVIDVLDVFELQGIGGVRARVRSQPFGRKP